MSYKAIFEQRFLLHADDVVVEGTCFSLCPSSTANPGRVVWHFWAHGVIVGEIVGDSSDTCWRAYFQDKPVGSSASLARVKRAVQEAYFRRPEQPALIAVATG